MIMTQLRTLKGGELIPSTTSSSSTTARKVESHSDRFTRRCSNFNIFQKTFFDIISPRHHRCLLFVWNFFPSFSFEYSTVQKKVARLEPFYPHLSGNFFIRSVYASSTFAKFQFIIQKEREKNLLVIRQRRHHNITHGICRFNVLLFFVNRISPDTHKIHRIFSRLLVVDVEIFSSRFRFPPSHTTPRNLRISSSTHSNLLICFNFSATNNNKHSHRMAVDSHLVEATKELLSLNPRDEQHEKWNILTNLFELEQVDERALGDVKIVTPN